MAEVIDFRVEANKRVGPDPEFVKKDDFGREMYLFALEYDMPDGSYAAQIWAYGHDDAQRKVDAMRASLRPLGQMYAAVRA